MGRDSTTAGPTSLLEVDDASAAAHDGPPAADLQHQAEELPTSCDLFSADPFLGLVHRLLQHGTLRADQHRPGFPVPRWVKELVLVGLFLVPLTVIVAVVAGMGQATQPDGWARLGSDLRATFGLSSSLAPSTRFGLFRDVPSQLLLIAAWAMPSLTYVQWELFEKAFPHYVASDLIAYFDEPEPPPGLLQRRFPDWYPPNRKWREVFRWTNRRMANVGKQAWWVLLVSGGICVGLYSFLIHRPLFQLVARHYSDGQQRRIYHDWWASFDPHTVGAVIYILSATVLVYYSIIANVAGYRYFRGLCLRRRCRLVFNFDIFNRDGHYGWEEARRLLFMTYRIFILDGLVLIGLILVFSVNELLALWAFIALFVGSLAFYLIAPNACFIVRRKRAKDRELDALERMAASYAPGTPEFDTVARMIDRVNQVPTSLMHAWQRIAVSVTSLATLSAIVATIIAVRNG